MGLRSWLTPVFNETDYKHVLNVANNAEFCFGVSYIIQITKTGSPFKNGSVMIAWSGDGSDTINQLKNIRLIESSINLDNLLLTFPDWHKEPDGPESYGIMFTEEEEQQPDWTLTTNHTNSYSVDDNIDNSIGNYQETQRINSEIIEIKKELKDLSERVSGKSTQIDPLNPFETDPLIPFQIDPLIPAEIDPLKIG